MRFPNLGGWLGTAAFALSPVVAAMTGDSAEEQACRPVVPHDADAGIAITLAGGGTKASSFAMGVLAGSVTSQLSLSRDPTRFDGSLFWQSDAVSSVSGGSYAAFYAYSRLIRNRPETGAPQPADKNLQRYFRYCIPAGLQSRFSPELIAAEAARRGMPEQDLFCPTPVGAGSRTDPEALAAARAYWNGEGLRRDTVHQQFVRCHADILTWQRCEFGNSVGARIRSNTTYGALVGVSLLSLPMAWVANTIFDWPINLSPSRIVYREGIGISYGLEPVDARALERDISDAAQVGAVRHFVIDQGVDRGKTSFANHTPRDSAEAGLLDRGDDVRIRPDPARMTFAGLASLYADGRQSPPRWVINATAAPSRSILGWTGRNDTNFDRDIFHMTADQQCAGGVGAVNVDLALPDLENHDRSLEKGRRNASLLTAVNASAAFFDANQRVYGQPVRFSAALAQHVLNLNWGLDLRNIDEAGVPKASDARRAIHLALPAPLYLGESYAAYVTDHDPVYVRLVDGGSSDNLGAYAPIVEGVKDVIVSDHAEDKGGSMGDLCLLRNELLIRKGLHLHVPGLAGWPRGCYDDLVLRRSSRRMAGTTQAARDAQAALEEVGDAMDAHGEPRVRSYPIWGWPYPFMAGCVSGDANPDSCLSAPRTRLWIIKPAFDYPDWRLRQTVEQRADDRMLTRYGEDDTLPCESSAFLARLLAGKGAIDDNLLTPIFPQDSTVSMTINSYADLVGAYRELGRHYTAIATGELDKVRAEGAGSPRFAALLCHQAAHPIPAAMADKTLGLSLPDYEFALEKWTRAERDAARYRRDLPFAGCSTLGLPLFAPLTVGDRVPKAF